MNLINQFFFNFYGKYKKNIFWFISLILLIIVIQNLFYVAGFKLGKIKIGNKKVVISKSGKLPKNLIENIDKKVQLNLYKVNQPEKDDDWSFKLSDLGITFSVKDASNHFFNYNPKQMLVPLGWLFFESNYKISDYYNFSSSVTQEFIKEKISKFNVQPIDAKINISESNEISVDNDSFGNIYSYNLIVKSIKNAIDSNEDFINVNAEIVRANQTKSELDLFLPDINRILNKPVKFFTNDKSVILLDKTELAKAVQVSSNIGIMQINFNKNKIKEYLEQKLNNIFGILPNDKVVNIKNGKEELISEGITGKTIDSDIMAESYINNLISFVNNSNKTEIEVKLKDVAPSIKYTYSYDKSQSGLDELVEDLGKRYGDVSISVQELYGQGRKSSYGGDNQKVAASTYKLVVAYTVAKMVDSGEISWNSSILDKTTDECLNLMIINSDNNCAEEWLSGIVGINKINETLNNLNMGRSCFTCGYAKSSTNDQLKILDALINNNDLTVGSSSKIIDLMFKQVYRSGIPSGTSFKVADKVGFLEGYLNDSAIIYTNKGPLLMSIYTNGMNWDDIADISREIINNCD